MMSIKAQTSKVPPQRKNQILLGLPKLECQRLAVMLPLIVTLMLLLPVSAQEKYGRYKIETRGKNPARLKWEDVGRAYEAFGSLYRELYDKMEKETHGFFHGKMAEYWPKLSGETKIRLKENYARLFANEVFLPMRFLTYEEVFGIGKPPSELLFPSEFSRGRTSFVEEALRGVMLRGKNGEEKGVIRAVRDLHDSFSLAHAFEVTTKDGLVKVESGIAPDALTVRWSDIGPKRFVSTVDFVQ
jgi:hypothetical protein